MLITTIIVFYSCGVIFTLGNLHTPSDDDFQRGV